MIHGTVDADLVELLSRVLAMALAASAVSAVSAFLYRWYSGQRAPDGVPILLGLSVIALWLNTTDILASVLSRGDAAVDEGVAAATVATFVAGTVAADAGRRLGDHLGADLPSVRDVRGLDADVGQIVRAAGRVVRVTVPEAIDDIDGYEPVPAEVKADLAGQTFLFPRRLGLPELRERLVDRLKHDYDVGHVDVELAADGTVEYLALGRRLAGIGQTLAPGSVAVAIRADPAFSATPGDRVQVWRDGGSGPQRVLTGELRAAVEDVATVVVDEDEVGDLAPDERYRLVTMPSEAQPEREFASLLRAADETMTAVTVAEGSDLAGTAVGALPLTVVGVERDGQLEALPDRESPLAPGETVYAIGRLDEIRRLEQRAGGASGAAVEASPAPGAER